MLGYVVAELLGQDVTVSLFASGQSRPQRSVDMLKDRILPVPSNRFLVIRIDCKLPRAPMCFLKICICKKCSLSQLALRAAGNLIVIRCRPGTASAVAFALDDVELITSCRYRCRRRYQF